MDSDLLNSGRGLARPVTALLLIIALAAASFSPPTVRRADADGPVLAVDANPSGNQPTELGPLDPCVSVSSGDRFQVDVIIREVNELLAWEIYLAYDPAIIEVAQRDVHLFQEANPGSAVFDVSERVPDSDGIYRLAAADTSDPPSPDSGSGVLARLTLLALSQGRSEITLSSRDLDGDGRPDQAPVLRNVAGEIIGDRDGDAFFDGPRLGALVAVDEPCPQGLTESGPALVSTDSGFPRAYVWGPVAGAIGLASAAAVFLLFRRRTQAGAKGP